MFILRLILLLVAALFVRRLVRSAFAPRSADRDGARTEPQGAPRPGKGGTLSEQDISDADFEEIP